MWDSIEDTYATQVEIESLSDEDYMARCILQGYAPLEYCTERPSEAGWVDRIQLKVMNPLTADVVNLRIAIVPDAILDTQTTLPTFYKGAEASTYERLQVARISSNDGAVVSDWMGVERQISFEAHQWVTFYLEKPFRLANQYNFVLEISESAGGDERRNATASGGASLYYQHVYAQHAVSWHGTSSAGYPWSSDIPTTAPFTGMAFEQKVPLVQLCLMPDACPVRSVIEAEADFSNIATLAAARALTQGRRLANTMTAGISVSLNGQDFQALGAAQEFYLVDPQSLYYFPRSLSPLIGTADGGTTVALSVPWSLQESLVDAEEYRSYYTGGDVYGVAPPDNLLLKFTSSDGTFLEFSRALLPASPTPVGEPIILTSATPATEAGDYLISLSVNGVNFWPDTNFTTPLNTSAVCAWTSDLGYQLEGICVDGGASLSLCSDSPELCGCQGEVLVLEQDGCPACCIEAAYFEYYGNLEAAWSADNGNDLFDAGAGTLSAPSSGKEASDDANNDVWVRLSVLGMPDPAKVNVDNVCCEWLTPRDVGTGESLENIDDLPIWEDRSVANGYEDSLCGELNAAIDSEGGAEIIACRAPAIPISKSTDYRWQVRVSVNHQDFIGQACPGRCPAEYVKGADYLSTACPHGYYAEAYTSRCRSCPMGSTDLRIGDTTATTEHKMCTFCPVGRYMPLRGHTGACYSCPSVRGDSFSYTTVNINGSEIVGQVSVSACSCAENYYRDLSLGEGECQFDVQDLSLRGNSTLTAGWCCSECPPGGVCPGGFTKGMPQSLDVVTLAPHHQGQVYDGAEFSEAYFQLYPYAKPGYFRLDAETEGLIQECSPRFTCASDTTEVLSSGKACIGACMGGGLTPTSELGIQFPNSCSTGYESLMCSSCSVGFYKDGGACKACPTKSPILLTLAAMFMIAGLWAFAKFSRFFKGLGSPRILVNFATVTVAFINFQIAWPDILVQFFEKLSFFTVNIDLIHAECEVNISFEQNWLFTMSIPFWLFWIFLLLYTAECFFNWFKVNVKAAPCPNSVTCSGTVNTMLFPCMHILCSSCADISFCDGESSRSQCHVCGSEVLAMRDVKSFWKQMDAGERFKMAQYVVAKQLPVAAGALLGELTGGIWAGLFGKPVQPLQDDDSLEDERLLDDEDEIGLGMLGKRAARRRRSSIQRRSSAEAGEGIIRSWGPIRPGQHFASGRIPIASHSQWRNGLLLSLLCIFMSPLWLIFGLLQDISNKLFTTRTEGASLARGLGSLQDFEGGGPAGALDNLGSDDMGPKGLAPTHRRNLLGSQLVRQQSIKNIESLLQRGYVDRIRAEFANFLVSLSLLIKSTGYLIIFGVMAGIPVTLVMGLGYAILMSYFSFKNRSAVNSTEEIFGSSSLETITERRVLRIYVRGFVGIRHEAVMRALQKFTAALTAAILIPLDIALIVATRAWLVSKVLHLELMESYARFEATAQHVVGESARQIVLNLDGSRRVIHEDAEEAAALGVAAASSQWEENPTPSSPSNVQPLGGSVWRARETDWYRVQQEVYATVAKDVEPLGRGIRAVGFAVFLGFYALTLPFLIITSKILSAFTWMTTPGSGTRIKGPATRFRVDVRPGAFLRVLIRDVGGTDEEDRQVDAVYNDGLLAIERPFEDYELEDFPYMVLTPAEFVKTIAAKLGVDLTDTEALRSKALALLRKKGVAYIAQEDPHTGEICGLKLDDDEDASLLSLHAIVRQVGLSYGRWVRGAGSITTNGAVVTGSMTKGRYDWKRVRMQILYQLRTAPRHIRSLALKGDEHWLGRSDIESMPEHIAIAELELRGVKSVLSSIPGFPGGETDGNTPQSPPLSFTLPPTPRKKLESPYPATETPKRPSRPSEEESPRRRERRRRSSIHLASGSLLRRHLVMIAESSDRAKEWDVDTILFEKNHPRAARVAKIVGHGMQCLGQLIAYALLLPVCLLLMVLSVIMPLLPSVLDGLPSAVKVRSRLRILRLDALKHLEKKAVLSPGSVASLGSSAGSPRSPREAIPSLRLRARPASGIFSSPASPVSLAESTSPRPSSIRMSSRPASGIFSASTLRRPTSLRLPPSSSPLGRAAAASRKSQRFYPAREHVVQQIDSPTSPDQVDFWLMSPPGGGMVNEFDSRPASPTGLFALDFTEKHVGDAERNVGDRESLFDFLRTKGFTMFVRESTPIEEEETGREVWISSVQFSVPVDEGSAAEWPAVASAGFGAIPPIWEAEDSLLSGMTTAESLSTALETGASARRASIRSDGRESITPASRNAERDLNDGDQGDDKSDAGNERRGSVMSRGLAAILGAGELNQKGRSKRGLQAHALLQALRESEEGRRLARDLKLHLGGLGPSDASVMEKMVDTRVVIERSISAEKRVFGRRAQGTVTFSSTHVANVWKKVIDQDFKSWESSQAEAFWSEENEAEISDFGYRVQWTESVLLFYIQGFFRGLFFVTAVVATACLVFVIRLLQWLLGLVGVGKGVKLGSGLSSNWQDLLRTRYVQQLLQDLKGKDTEGLTGFSRWRLLFLRWLWVRPFLSEATSVEEMPRNRELYEATFRSLFSPQSVMIEVRTEAESGRLGGHFCLSLEHGSTHLLPHDCPDSLMEHELRQHAILDEPLPGLAKILYKKSSIIIIDLKGKMSSWCDELAPGDEIAVQVPAKELAGTFRLRKQSYVAVCNEELPALRAGDTLRLLDAPFSVAAVRILHGRTRIVLCQRWKGKSIKGLKGYIQSSSDSCLPGVFKATQSSSFIRSSAPVEDLEAAGVTADALMRINGTWVTVSDVRQRSRPRKGNGASRWATEIELRSPWPGASDNEARGWIRSVSAKASQQRGVVMKIRRHFGKQQVGIKLTQPLLFEANDGKGKWMAGLEIRRISTQVHVSRSPPDPRGGMTWRINLSSKVSEILTLDSGA
jgi:hypothetical protein